MNEYGAYQERSVWLMAGCSRLQFGSARKKKECDSNPNSLGGAGSQ